MGQSVKRCSLFLVFLQLSLIFTPSHAMFSILGGGGGGGDDEGSDVAEILAAGLITKMLMEDVFHIQSGSIFQSMRHQFSGGYSMQPRIPQVPQMRHYHPMHTPMMAPRIPVVMRAQYVVPIMPRHPVHMMNHDTMMKQAAIMKQEAMMRQAAMMKQAAMMNQAAMLRQARHPALPPSWNGRYQDLRGSETFVNAYLPIRKSSGHSIIDELLTNEALSAATLLLNSDLLDDDEDEDEEEVFVREEAPEVSEEPEKQDENPSETIEASGSEHESRYILPRIVRHFVQRIMRRVEQHR